MIRVGLVFSRQEMADTQSKEPQINSSDVLFLQTLPISAEAKYQEVSYLFPHQDAFRCV